MRFFICAMILWVLLFTSIVSAFLIGGAATYLGFVENRVSLVVIGPAYLALSTWIIYRERKILYTIWSKGF